MRNASSNVCHMFNLIASKSSLKNGCKKCFTNTYCSKLLRWNLDVHYFRRPISNTFSNSIEGGLEGDLRCIGLTARKKYFRYLNLGNERLHSNGTIDTVKR